MNPKAAKLIISVMLIATPSAFAQTWQVVDEAATAAQGTWSEVECKDTSGWAVCERQAPEEECKYSYSSPVTYFLLREGPNGRPGSASIYWDGVLAASFGNPNPNRRLPNTIRQSQKYLIDREYYYYLRPGDKGPYKRGNREVYWRVCRIGV